MKSTDKAHATATRTSCLATSSTLGLLRVRTYVQAPATAGDVPAHGPARAMASAARGSPAGRSAFDARSTTGRSRGTRTNYVARAAPAPFPLLSAILVGFLLSRAGRVRGGPSCVCVSVWAGGRARARDCARERWSCGRQVGRRARPPWCRGGGGWTQAHAGPRQTERDRVPAAAGVRCGLREGVQCMALLLDAVRIRCS